MFIYIYIHTSLLHFCYMFAIFLLYCDLGPGGSRSEWIMLLRQLAPDGICSICPTYGRRQHNNSTWAYRHTGIQAIGNRQQEQATGNRQHNTPAGPQLIAFY